MAIPWLEERHLAMWEVLGGEFPGVAKDTHISQGRKIKSFYMYIYIIICIYTYLYTYIHKYIYIYWAVYLIKLLISTPVHLIPP